MCYLAEDENCFYSSEYNYVTVGINLLNSFLF
jgi:hypothetical protein